MDVLIADDGLYIARSLSCVPKRAVFSGDVAFDDCLTKPFSPGEVVARGKGIIGRPG